MTLHEVVARFPDARRNGKGYKARCPVHGDHDPSLDIDPGDSGVLVKCRAERGCTTEEICGKVGLTLRDLAYVPRESAPRREAPRTIVATYAYTDEAGETLYEAVRYAPKDFRQRQPDGKGGWSWSMQGARYVPYALDRLQGQATVYIVEGEKDADALWALGLPATTNIGGAGKWRPEYSAALVDAGVKHAVVFPDHDPAGTTHSRAVADDCLRAGLLVKLVPLPGLPPKGDVSDYLADHTKAELGRVVREAPLYDPTRPVVDEIPLALTSLADLLAKPRTEIDYVVQDRIPAGSVVLFCAPPKTGKSTATRSMALAVSRGQPWCGWRTTPGPVWVLALEDQESEVVAHFARMGAVGDEPLRFFCGPPPPDLLANLRALALRERPRLIVIDHLGLVLRAKDFNDYAQVTERFAPLLDLARGTGAALVLNFHASTHQQREGLDAVLGSTAISGSVDNVFVMKRDDQRRVLSTVQRIGPDLEPILIELNKDTGWFESLGAKRDREDHDLGDRMRDALREAVEPLGEATLKSAVVGRRQDQERILRKLVRMGWIVRLGTGGRHHPYTYTLPELVPPEGTVSSRFLGVPASSRLLPHPPTGGGEPEEGFGRTQESPVAVQVQSTYLVPEAELRSAAAPPLNFDDDPAACPMCGRDSCAGDCPDPEEIP